VIDIRTEELLTLSAAASLLPGRPSISTMWRWRTKGARGRRLESVTLGGKVYTSAEALQRFAHHAGGAVTPTLRTSRQRERDIARAEQELNDAGI